MEKLSEKEVYDKVLKLLSSTKENFVTISYSDVLDGETSYRNALNKLEKEHYKIETTDEYFGDHLTRGETVYKSIIYKKTPHTEAIFQKEKKAREEELSRKIKGLEYELDKYRKELREIDLEDLENWFNNVCGNAYYIKFTEHDSDYFGIFRVEEIDYKNTYSNGYVFGTLVQTYPTKKDYCGVDFKFKASKDQIKEERKITKSQFNKILEKTRKMIIPS